MTADAVAATIVPSRPAWRSLLWTIPFTMLWTWLIYSLPVFLESGLPALTVRLMVHGLIALGLWLGLERTDLTSDQRRTTWLAIMVPFTLWAAVAWTAAINGVFRTSGRNAGTRGHPSRRAQGRTPPATTAKPLRRDEVHFSQVAPRTKAEIYCLTGKSLNCCPAPFAKIFPFPLYPNQIYMHRRPTPLEGRIAIVTDAGRDAVDAAASGDARGWQGGSIRPVS